MRIQLICSTKDDILPFNYQHQIVGVLHRWLGQNQLHDAISLYSFSWLNHLMKVEEGLKCKGETSFFISFYEEQYLKQLIEAVLNDPSMFSGIEVKEIRIVPTPDFTNKYCFHVATPILIKKLIEGESKYFYYTDDQSNIFLKETVDHKMQQADLPKDETLQIHFDKEDPRRKIKMITIHGIKNKASQCSVWVEGKPSTLEFIWNVGLGHSTGNSFGALY